MTATFTLVDSRSLGDLQVFLGRAGRVEDGSVRLIAGSGVLAAYVAILYPVGLLDETPTILGLRTFALTTKDVFDVVVPQRSLVQRLARLQNEMSAASPLAGVADAPDASGGSGVSDAWDASAGSGVAAASDASAGSGASDALDASDVPEASHVSAPVTVNLPMEVHTVTWAAISPPRRGWTAFGGLDSGVLEAVAKAGIDEVAGVVPDPADGQPSPQAGEQIIRRIRAEVWGRPIEGFDHIPAGGAFAALSLGFLGQDRQVAVYES
ncbi:MAG: hypothetical protein ACYCZK_03250, partial [Microbacteriaceae bacterium]